jgi:hypothetical protein
MPALLSDLAAGLLLALALIALPAQAQTQAAHRAPALREPALDQLAAPIALYPDALLAQLLMASTYPLDVAEAARSASKGAGRARSGHRWEGSVRALLPAMPILVMMNREKNWTRQLAAAVTGKPAVLLDTIQALRERAYENGVLHSGPQQQVQRQDRVIVIQPADARRLYVPYYDPAQVYGAAGNSILPPEYWTAQPYAAPQNRPAGDGVVFSTGIDLPDRNLYNAGIDWRNGRLLLRRIAISGNAASTGPGEWRHDPHYRTRKRCRHHRCGSGRSSGRHDQQPRRGPAAAAIGGRTDLDAPSPLGRSVASPHTL